MILGLFALGCVGVSLLWLWRTNDPMTIQQLKVSCVSSGVISLVCLGVEAYKALW